jgi:ArsR family transcriptional regulator
MASRSIESTDLEHRAGVFAAIGDPLRLRILDELDLGSRCVCELHQSIGIAPNLLSYHLRVLREAGLVEATRRGRWVDYSIAPRAGEVLKKALPVSLIAKAGA